MPSRSESTSSDAQAQRARLIGAAGGGLFLAASVGLVATQGLILTRDWVFAWVLVGLLAISLADPVRWARGVVVDWLPLMALLLCYDLSRPVREWIGIAPHVHPQLDADRALFGGAVPTVELQHRFHDAEVAHWYDYLAFATYLSHFFVTLVVLAVLWKVAYPRFREYRTLVVALATVGFACYVLFPAAPPWLAAWHGHLEPVPRTIAEMWGHVGIAPAQALFEDRGEFYNQEAAVPSLHAAFPMLLALFLWPANRWARAGLVAYVLAMGLTLVYTGEHYVSDVLAGWLAAAAVVAGVSHARAWRRSRRAPPPRARAAWARARARTASGRRRRAVPARRS